MTLLMIDDFLQYVAVFVIVAIALMFFIKNFLRRNKNAECDSCYGCRLKDACNKKNTTEGERCDTIRKTE